jgi:hypothetical protein
VEFGNPLPSSELTNGPNPFHHGSIEHGEEPVKRIAVC